MEKLIPITQRKIDIKHKIINGQPHLEVQVFDNRYNLVLPRDTMTIRLTQNEELTKIIRAWLYE